MAATLGTKKKRPLYITSHVNMDGICPGIPHANFSILESKKFEPSWISDLTKILPSNQHGSSYLSSNVPWAEWPYWCLCMNPLWGHSDTETWNSWSSINKRRWIRENISLAAIPALQTTPNTRMQSTWAMPISEVDVHWTKPLRIWRGFPCLHPSTPRRPDYVTGSSVGSKQLPWTWEA